MRDLIHCICKQITSREFVYSFLASKVVMAATTGRITVGHRILMGFNGDAKIVGGAAKSLADMDFGCFDEDIESSPGSSCNEIDDEDKEVTPESVAESKAFWDDQYQLLHTTLSRTTALESRIREITKEAMEEFSTQGICLCTRPITDGGCRNCMMKKIHDRLQNAGFDSAICKSKWRRSQDIPAGEHTYVDVMEKSSSKKGGDIRVVIELGFRAEFVIGRPSGEYNKLINRLPEVFVGKAERLKTVVKMLCSAAKKCMNENKMHMGPWRTHKYVKAKWFSPCERRTVSERTETLLNLPTGFTDQYRTSSKPKSSMLSFNLQLHLTAVVGVV